MEDHQKFLKKNLDEQQELQNHMNEDLIEAFLSLVASYSENQKLEELQQNHEKRIWQIQAEASEYRKAIEKLSRENAANECGRNTRASVARQALSAIALVMVDMCLIDKYQKLKQLSSESKSTVQVQKEFDAARLQKGRVLVNVSKIQGRVDEKKRCIDKRELPVYHKFLEVKKKIVSVNQQHEELNENYDELQGRVTMLKGKKEHLQKELKKKQQLKAQKKVAEVATAV